MLIPNISSAQFPNVINNTGGSPIEINPLQDTFHGFQTRFFVSSQGGVHLMTAGIVLGTSPMLPHLYLAFYHPVMVDTLYLMNVGTVDSVVKLNVTYKSKLCIPRSISTLKQNQCSILYRYGYCLVFCKLYRNQ